MARDPYMLVSIEAFEALREAAEQAADLRAIRAMKKADWETVSFDEYPRSKRRRASA